MNKEREKIKNDLQKDLMFYLEQYKELSVRSKEMKRVIDKEISELIRKLKELGK
ncbi:MAG: hypothetical protein KF900_02530 [Bacteroidetes bacterium]|nr:hypothetical protein [Bacteroidota bacterium]